MNIFTRGTPLLRCMHQRRRTTIPPHLGRRRTLADVSGKAASPHVVFYKDFGGPVAKVFLMAFFAYQVTYWAWLKMEKEEERSEKEKEVSAIEREVVRVRDEVRSRKSRNAGG
ncbi:hypothetical protein HOY80DRAFT_1040064 [Tuber brumale]|nr:hypothetical protein HOY80DRAFT_1040064 [Tuber brumale]